ncbi:MAG: hypothetical protein GX189_07435 [Clostridiales bacterium]|nr:hypothetical protein [Clostridiales bacterium]
MRRIKIPFVLVLHIAFIVAVYALQAMIFPHLPIAGYVPVLLPVAAVGIALFEGASRGGGYGLLAGMLCDVAFHQPVLAMTVTLTAIGIACGILSETILARSFPSYIVCCFFALMITSFIPMFTLLFYAGVDPFSLFQLALGQTLVSLIFACPLYFFIRLLARSADAL